MSTRYFLQRLALPAVLALLPVAVVAQNGPSPLPKPPITFKIQFANERLEMTVHSSRILTMDQKIPQAQVNNPDILELVMLSPNQVQLSAKAAGVTTVNLWGEDKKVSSVDVIVYGDTKALEVVLQTQFPTAALKVVPVGNDVMISGFVDQPEQIDRIIRVAEEYYPKVINNMTVGGVQQVLLRVKVMEVSRTKLRNLGFDWALITDSSVITSGVTGLISDFNPTQLISPGQAFRTGSPGTFSFGVVNGSNAFFGVLNALRQDELLKILSEPTLVANSGRAASFNSGGEIPVPEPQSLGTISISWKKYGTQVDFVPIVLGNGKIRLEVRPRISELDQAHSTTVAGTTVPGILLRETDTAVEMQAGQTLAIAGLVQTVIESENRGLPWIGDVPYLGAVFSSKRENRNDIELLIMVTPELVDAVDACEVPPCGPGMQTCSPSDWEFYMKGHLEVPCGPKCGCRQPCGPDGAPANGPGVAPPPDGMMPAPGETIPPPPPGGNAANPPRLVRDSSAVDPAGVAVAQGSGRTSSPYSRYARSKANSSGGAAASTGNPPGLIGPVGYDVVK
jgi:pilus assembly protein CpaC